MSGKKKRWGWTRSINDDIDITDRKTPHCLYAAPFITSVRQAKAVCAALNALESRSPTPSGGDQ